MFRRFLFLTLIVLSISCKKNDTASTTGSAAATVSFTASGTSYSWTEETNPASPNFLSMAIYGSGYNTFTFSVTSAGSNNLLPDRMILLTISTPTLTANVPYTYTNTAAVLSPPHFIVAATTTTYNPSVVFEARQAGDFATVTITSIHNGLANGTFSAMLTRASDGAKITITVGQFQNVSIT